MTGCSAFGCSNRAEQGFKLTRFPKDPFKRRLWAVKLRRKDWVPTVYTSLCEVHFTRDQWFDFDKKKLKKDAVPTLFSYNNFCDPRKMPNNSPFSNKIRCEDENIDTYRKIANKSPSPKKIRCEDENTDESDETTMFDGTRLCDVVSKFDKLSKWEKLCKYAGINKDDETMRKDSDKDEIIKYLYKKLVESNQVITDLKAKNSQLQIHFSKKAEKLENERNINIFSDDQNLALRKNMAFTAWSEETLKKASLLKSACGSKGYKHILSLGLPFPSVRTLQRHLKSQDHSSKQYPQNDEPSNVVKDTNLVSMQQEVVSLQEEVIS